MPPLQFPFDNSYARLPERLYARIAPTPVRAPRLLRFNGELARELGLDPDTDADELARVFAGNRVPHGAEPIAQAYAGHQFGGFVPQLGDGRALLLGEVVDLAGRRRDIQLKGSGPTPYSRRGDGRAGLGPVLREYLVSEAMHALGVPTTRALAAVATGEPVYREQPQQGAVLVRVAASHLRVGTFEYFAVRRDREALAALVDYALARHQPESVGADRPALELLRGVMARQARLVARWMGVGFIHGVMNTDNTSISGETIDYGPCAFLDTYRADTVYSSIDRWGRYAYGAQPQIIQWNLARLCESLLPVIDDQPDRAVALAQSALDRLGDQVQSAWLEVMRAKLGLTIAAEDDRDLIVGWLDAMQAGGADFTNAQRALCDAADDPAADDAVRAAFAEPERYDAWAPRWRARLAREASPRGAAMRGVNPALVPRNHLVERALAAAAEGDVAPLERLAGALSRPYDDQPEHAELSRPAPLDQQRAYKTFCGT